MPNPVKDPTVQDPIVTPVAGGDPVEGGEKFELPEHLKGKTPDELAKMVMDKETQIGKQSTEIGDLRTNAEKARDDLNYLRGAEEIRRHQESKRLAELETQRPEPDKPKWNYEDPVRSVDERVDTRLRQEKEESFRSRVTANIGVARTSFTEGQKVMEQDKGLFEGIEEETRNAVFQYYAPYLQAGHDVSQQMRDPKAWRVAAQNIRLNRGEIDRIKASPSPGINPVSPTDQEIPGSPAGPGGPVGELDPEVKHIAESYGLTTKEAQEIIQEEAKLGGRN